ncbi:MAG: hypothetical protein H6666_12210 [Ardenticatenaceae bacterium]|nr:hypothetical protein [Anaerolineales bacterium]MCB8918674.1 hypothetical protein [Ardenticatenaceae bacterium]
MLPINYQDEVWTSDGQRLGVAHHYYERPDEAQPDLLFYAAYVEVENFDLGMTYYIPTDFFAERGESSGRVTLTVPMKTVLNRTWTRRPEFVIRGLAQEQELPAG